MRTTNSTSESNKKNQTNNNNNQSSSFVPQSPMKFFNDPSFQTSSQQTSSQSMPDYLNQFNLLLLSNQLNPSSISHDFLHSQSLQKNMMNIACNENSISQQPNSDDLRKQYYSSTSPSSKKQQKKVEEQKEHQKQSIPLKQLSMNEQIIRDSLEQEDDKKRNSNNNNEKTRTFSFNDNNQNQQQNQHFEQQENTQITREQLLLGLMGLEQQLKKLQDQSQSKIDQNDSSSNQEENQINDQREEEDELERENEEQIEQEEEFDDNSCQFQQQPPQHKLVSFSNIPNENAIPHLVATPTRKRSTKAELKNNNNNNNNCSNSKQSQTILSRCYSQNDILTPSTKQNIIINKQNSMNYSDNYETERKSQLSPMNSMNLSQFNNNNISNEINEFCLDDDDENPRIETSTMSESKSRDFNKIKEIIYFIVNNLEKDEPNLAIKRCFIQEDEHFSDKTSAYLIIFDRLIKKFKHLKKTKEEKTKFCMRKAFRYLFAQLKTICNSKMNLKEANEICMKHYFSQHVNDSQFVLPFRRNSSIKTMNAAFLKKVFSSTKFVSDYRDFLHFFDRLSFEDNSKKVDQLAYYILPMLEENKFEKIEGLRRLPWTMSLLDSTRSLAYQLLEFEENHIPLNQSSQQTIPLYPQQSQQPSNPNNNELNLKGDSSPTHPQSIFNNPLLCANNLSALCQSHQFDETLSNFDTLSVQTQNRMVNDSFINMDFISRKFSMSSSDSQNNNSQDCCDSRSLGGENTQLTDLHLAYLKQINSALIEFQSNWSSQQQQQSKIDKPKNTSLKRSIIVLTPPLYDLNENPHKKIQFNFSCKS